MKNKKLAYLMDKDVDLKSTGYRSQGIISPEGLVFIAGQVGAEPHTKELVSPSMYEQSIQCLKNIEQVVKKAGGSRDDLVQLHVYITDKEKYPEFNQATKEFFGEFPPTRSVVGATFLAGDALLEISAIAYLKGEKEEKGGDN